jgi:hypothetical protein
MYGVYGVYGEVSDAATCASRILSELILPGNEIGLTMSVQVKCL